MSKIAPSEVGPPPATPTRGGPLRGHRPGPRTTGNETADPACRSPWAAPARPSSSTSSWAEGHVAARPDRRAGPGSGKSTLLHALITNAALHVQPGRGRALPDRLQEGRRIQDLRHPRPAPRPCDRHRERARVRPERPPAARRRTQGPGRPLPRPSASRTWPATAPPAPDEPCPASCSSWTSSRSSSSRTTRSPRSRPSCSTASSARAGPSGCTSMLGSQTLGGAYSPGPEHPGADGRPHRPAVLGVRRPPDPQRGQRRRPPPVAARARRSTTTPTARSRGTTSSRSFGCPIRPPRGVS